MLIEIIKRQSFSQSKAPFRVGVMLYNNNYGFGVLSDFVNDLPPHDLTHHFGFFTNWYV